MWIISGCYDSLGISLMQWDWKLYLKCGGKETCVSIKLELYCESVVGRPKLEFMEFCLGQSQSRQSKRLLRMHAILKLRATNSVASRPIVGYLKTVLKPILITYRDGDAFKSVSR